MLVNYSEKTPFEYNYNKAKPALDKFMILTECQHYLTIWDFRASLNVNFKKYHRNVVLIWNFFTINV